MLQGHYSIDSCFQSFFQCQKMTVLNNKPVFILISCSCFLTLDNDIFQILIHVQELPKTRIHIYCFLVFCQPELIRFWGYVCEEHFVTTRDGYRIGIHRSPRGRDEPATTTNSSTVKSVVLLGHGIISSSSAWTFGPPDKSLGYVLADAGKFLTFVFL